ncbi:protein kinase domain containing protein [Entamoeba histolytica HM-3:IMSS]|uniref:non-specific serine/threonine protein kinase n=5 Tax=Entamoeba histolytica TaxID=5759 RepID=A0A8U0WPJ9_ENTH1|nr:protein kinase domain containing protein [Entamoeba histolytica HM-1:IMSS]EMD46953.1 protein kinase domain containing protein [Entamoeba histolytica KU27]EMS11239.1 protein kinase domain containing protein [Entamoeba histolytica HM-3:IMSS]ENY65117.1 protein kinase domain containing protein [Entamoeba histolytica HM-1:IMSS-A]BAC82422.1 hypothetical protein [Entamoeba histolytica]EAL43382.1 protein kinase domain containing protein [Entamoeba histolytica HM-1:IMSS]|eukprot:XP_648765.1 protein kinase domain containing protein [Entamoeba histolytica HM-1:IMSS]
MWGKFVCEQFHKEIPFNKGEMIIGRKAYEFLSSIVKVSVIHCIIKRSELPNLTVTTITDKSTNGTYLNGERLEKNLETYLSCFDEITFLNKITQPDYITFDYYDSTIIDLINKQCSLFKKYQLGKYIGKGSFGVVREIMELATNTKFAIKIINKEKAKNSLNQIHRECNTMKKINHPNSVKFKELFETNEMIFVIMELINGTTLEKVLKENSLSHQEKNDIIIELLQLLKYLHSIDIVHRDIKPENLMITRIKDEIHIKLIDFGFGKELTGTIHAATLCGTPLYAAPELFEDKKTGYDARKIDIWSAGVIIYIILTGRHPFCSNDYKIKELLDNIQHNSYSSFPCFNLLTDSQQLLLKGMFDSDVSKRFSASECLECLQRKRQKEISDVFCSSKKDII